MQPYAIADEQFPTQITNLTVITKPKSDDPKDICSNCISTTRALDRRGIAYREVPSDQIPEHLQHKIKALNLQTIPVLVANDDLILAAGSVQHPVIAKIKDALAS